MVRSQCLGSERLRAVGFAPAGCALFATESCRGVLSTIGATGAGEHADAPGVDLHHRRVQFRRQVPPGFGSARRRPPPAVSAIRPCWESRAAQPSAAPALLPAHRTVHQAYNGLCQSGWSHARLLRPGSRRTADPAQDAAARWRSPARPRVQRHYVGTTPTRPARQLPHEQRNMGAGRAQRVDPLPLTNLQILGQPPPHTHRWFAAHAPDLPRSAATPAPARAG
jgi:hypothetical protein